MGVREGKRDSTCAKLAGYYLRLLNGDRQQTRDILYSWNVRNEPPMQNKQVDKVVNSIAERHALQSKEFKTFHRTDLGNAERLVRLHGRDLHFCHPWKRWYVFNGKRWAQDDTAVVKRRAKETVKSIFAEAASAPDSEASHLAKHAIRSEADIKIRAMLSLAESEEGIPVLPDELDADPWLLNVNNGTLDLKTGELLAHNRNHLITKLCPTNYDPQGTCPRWEKVLKRVFGENQNIIKFLQKAVGYSLTGDISEQCFFNFYGTGENGKTTLLETVAALLGDYGQQTPIQTFLQKRNETISSDIAKLKGARFVTAVEPEAGHALAESLIKQLTGGDRVSARFLHREWFSYHVTYKIFIATNYRVKIRGVGRAIWRRVREIPFNVRIPEAEQDKYLIDKLKQELPGILTWAVNGCTLWQKEGLGIPEEVKAATEAYRLEMDGLANFIDEKCFLKSDNQRVYVSKKDLYEAYQLWATETGEAYLGKKNFGTALKERGITDGKGGPNESHVWFGIGLLIDENEPGHTPAIKNGRSKSHLCHP